MCKLIEESQIREISMDLLRVIPEDDVYLVQTYFAAEGTILVTTDGTLHRMLSSADNVKVRLRNEFMADYMT